MRIVCPSCQAAYEVPDAALVSRRVVRCARCATEFAPGGMAEVVEPARVAEPVAAAPVLEAVVEPVQAPAPLAAPVAAAVPIATASLFDAAPAEMDARAAETTVRIAVAAGWVVSVALLACLAWSAVAWRGAVMRAWPASERGYAMLGYR